MVVGTHALPHLLDLLRRVGRGRAADGRGGVHGDVPERAAGRPGRRVPRVGLDRGRDATTRARSASCRSSGAPQRSRAIGDILAEVQGLVAAGSSRSTLLGQNVNTYGRDVTVPGSSRRPLFAELLRQVNEVDGLRRIRFTSPHPHDFTPDVIEAMAESEKVCEHIHFPLQSGSDHGPEGDAAFLPARALPGVAGRDPRGDPGRSPCRPTSSSGSRARPRRTSRETLDVVERARFDSRVHVPVLPAPGDARRLDARPGPEGGRAGAVRPPRRAPGRDHARASARADRDRTVEVLVEGAGREGRSTQARTRTNRIVHLRRAARRRARSSTRARHRGRVASPRRRGRAAPALVEAVGADASAPWSARPRAGRPRRRSASRRRSGRRSSRSTRCSCTAGWTWGRRSRRPNTGPGAAPLMDLAEPARARSRVARFQAAGQAAADDVRRRRRGRCWSAGRASTSARWSTTSAFPREDPVVRSGARGRGGRARVPTSLRATGRARPRRGGEDRTRERPPDRPGARGDRDHRRAVQRLRGGVGGVRPRSRCGSRGSVSRRETLTARVEATGAAMLDAGWLDEVEALVDRGFGGWLTAPRRRSATRRSRGISPVSSSLEEAVGADREADARRSRGARWRGSVVTRGSGGSTPARAAPSRSSTSCVGLPGGRVSGELASREVPGDRERLPDASTEIDAPVAAARRPRAVRPMVRRRRRRARSA